ncbi:MFS general substrate transporter [Naviculisporaceae sp. PSN 640]
MGFQHTKHTSSSVDITTGDVSSTETINNGNPGADVPEEAKHQYPSTLMASLLTFALCLAAFTTALDNTIIATAIPKITTQFDSLNDIGWYGSAYLLTTTALQPSFGKIFTYFNPKKTYLSALIIFEVGSIICAAAPNSTVFIVGRAIAGVGGAALFSGGMNILALVTPIHKRAMYNSLLTSMFGIASVVGPLLGGAFTDSRLTWRWCFWINLPFGAVAFGAVAVILKVPKGVQKNHEGMSLKERIWKLDLLGASVFIPGIVCLLLALQWGGVEYAWSDSKVWGCLLGFVLIMVCFVGTQVWRGDEATIPPRIIKQRTILSAALFICFLSMGIYAHFYFLPFYFQVVKGTSAVDSGIRTVPYIVSITIFAVVVGSSITVLGYYTPFTWFGASMFTVGAGLLQTLQLDTGSGKWIGYQVLAGVGAGSALQVPFIAVQCAVADQGDTSDIPVANALVGFFNSLGSAVSISVAQNIFSNTLRERLAGVEGIESPEMIIAAGATGVRDVTPPGALESVLEAYNGAIVTAFVFAIASGGVAFVCSLFLEMKSVKGRKLELAGAA